MSVKFILALSIFLQSCAYLPYDEHKARQAKILNLQGLVALREGKIAEAEANFDLAYQLFRNPESLDGLGACQFRANNFKEAKSYFLKTLKLFPEYHNSLINLAFLYDAKGDKRLALALYQRLVEKYPENYKLQNNFSAFLFDNYKKDSKKEIQHRLLQAKSFNPDSLIIKNLKIIAQNEK